VSDAPTATVIVVSDYGGWGADGWSDFARTLSAVAEQAARERAEVVVVDSHPGGRDMPTDVGALAPAARVVRGDGGEPAHDLLNAAVRSARAELVALLDGDCLPAPGWLAAALGAMRERPDAAAVSGRTTYPEHAFTDRVLAVLSRAFLDPGRAGPTRFVSPYNAIFRRDALVAHPLGAHQRAMAARLQSEAIRLAGGRLYFEPDMAVTHRFEGWAMERRIRRNVGYRAVRVRQLEPRVPHAWMLRLGIAAIPAIATARTLESCWTCLRVGRHYGLRWFEMPAAFAIAIAVHSMELGGMRAAWAEGRGEDARA